MNYTRFGLTANGLDAAAMRGRKKVLALFLFSAALGILPPVATAQVSTAQLSGVVSDPSGAAIPNAEVTATQTDTKLVGRATTNQQGVFTILALPVGPYTIDVSARGFAPYEETQIVLSVSQVANLHISMKLAGTNVSVTVTAETAMVETTDNTIKDVVEQNVVNDLPLNGRNPASLLYTLAGTNDATVNHPDNVAVRATDSDNPAESAPVINGSRPGSTYFSLDGAINTDPYDLLGGPFPNPDATQEFSVVTGTYGARYVSAPGGAVNIVTKSGTNDIHGTLFEFVRNGYFNARNALSLQPDVLKRNQFGFAAGGPIVRDRLFIFATYQGTRLSDSQTLTADVPTAAERAGNFVNTSNSPGSPFTVPVDPVIKNLLPLLPLPTGRAGDPEFLSFQSPIRQPDNQFVVKMDYDLGKSHRLFARYLFDHFYENAQGPTTGALIMGAHRGLKQPWDAGAVGDTWLSGNWVLDTRASFIRSQSFSFPVAQNFGWPTLGAQNLSQSPDHPGLFVTVIGNNFNYSGTGTFANFARTTIDFSEDVLVTKGNHQISFGGGYRHISLDEVNEAGQNPVVIFVGVNSSILGGIPPMFGGIQNADFNPMADFILGAPFIFIQGDGLFTASTGNLLGVYGEDKYRATSRLTITGGLRWDPYLPFTPRNGRATCWIPGEQSTKFVNAPNGLVFPGDPGCNASGTNSTMTNVQPRLGVAYQLDQAGKSAIRAGYGLYTTQLPLLSFLGFSSQPWVRTFMLTQPFMSIDNLYPSAGLTNPFAGGFNGPSFKPPATIPFVQQTGIASIASNFHPAYIQQWSLSFQQAITGSDSVEIAYVGTKGTRLSMGYDLNAPVYIPGSSSTQNEQQRRPIPTLQNIDQIRSNGNSSYNGLDVTYHHRSRKGLDWNSAFAWAKSIDDSSLPASTFGVSVPTLDHSVRRGLSDYDQPFTWRNTVTWNSPELQDRNTAARVILGSWLLSGLVAIDSGLPFSVTDSEDNSFSGSQMDLADRVPGVPAFVNGVLNPAAFAENAPGTFGNSGRNSFRQQGIRQIDIAIAKNFKLTERWGLTFRTEAFNLFNHPIFYNINSDRATPVSFGSYALAQNPRIMQFSLKLQF